MAELPDPEPISGDFTQQLPVTVTDVEGRQVTVTDTSRILALDIYGTLSRTVISLGLGDKLVGRTISSTEAQLAKLPVVTENGHSLNAEAILSLKPTVIVADRSVGPPEVLDQIAAAGVPVVLVEQERSLAKNGELMKTVAHALGMDQAGDALVTRTDKEIEEAKAQIAAWAPEKPLNGVFLYARGNAGVFFILGGGYGSDALLEGVGVHDIATAQGIKDLAPANAEALVSLNPEVYFMMTHGLESAGGLEQLLTRPGIADTIAGKNQRIVSIPDGMALSFGPQTAQVLLAVAKATYGVPAK
ncbi:ABC transporter substrate-binding protein [Boudabousia marimammalium]|uniref:ABC transporter substrate-binding protein n=1 Tax=Boudabousia marimammalium TaxID=156892 RepID=A0A1Q5PTA5_9ACTO|nr:ABC transporter substrate-binding protein [Boudabousia marimammalium]